MWYVNYFHVQIFAILFLFTWKLNRRRDFYLRLVPGALVYLALPYVVPGGFFAPWLRIGWFTFGFLIMLVLAAFLLAFCYKVTLKQVVFYCCLAHTLQHIVHCISRGFSLIIRPEAPWGQAVELAVFLVFTGAFYLLLRRRFSDAQALEVKSRFLVLFALFSSLVIYLVSYWTTMEEGETVGVFLFDIFTCSLLIRIMMDNFRILKAEQEQNLMLRLLRQEQEQHELSRDTIEVINRKCHDLKHQISALRSMTGAEQERSIGELEQAVLIYDRFAKSGNPDLDIILAEKSLLAEKQGIRIRCIADGARLGFLRTEDLYSLLGNALDNAIESAGHEPEEARRIIALNIAPRGSMVSVHLENPCPVAPVFLDGLPVTTKADKEYHGYGMKSMCYIAEKYGGVLTSRYEDGIFVLDILFPGEGKAEKSA
ncbi:MAG: GHKL domain-containing protein [Lachnospiraceae bacterium]|nr:GHKL domain-containing protein [Lachnospiraceae bacterium]